MRTVYACCGKRCCDIVLACIGLIVLSPLFLFLSVLIAIRLGRPVFFRQNRPGKDGVIFSMVKFRSMTDARDEDGNLLDDAVRLTRFGRILRSSSLDELPELWNVLKGDMSLVGPRPLLERYLGRYSAHQFRRHAVRPGVTGWAQVNGRNAIAWDAKFELDLWYVDHFSLMLDVRILLKTVGKLFSQRDVSAQGHVTMPEFEGNSEASAPETLEAPDLGASETPGSPDGPKRLADE